MSPDIFVCFIKIDVQTITLTYELAPPQTLSHTAKPSPVIRKPPFHSLNTPHYLIRGPLYGYSPCLKRLSAFNLDHYIANSFLTFQFKFHIFKRGFLWPPSPGSNVSFFFFFFFTLSLWGSLVSFSNLKMLGAAIESI